MWVIHFSIKKWLGEISYETSYVTMKHQVAGDLAKPLAQLISLWADTEQNARCSLPASLPCKRRSIINTHMHRECEWKKNQKLSQYGGTLQPCSTALWPLSPHTPAFFSYNVLHYIHVLHIYKCMGSKSRGVSTKTWFHWNALELHANLQANIGGLLVPDPEVRPLPCSEHPVTHSSTEDWLVHREREHIWRV